MPRGKDAPAQVGGQIDPYVQQSMQQSKQQAQNRLLAATQEAGAARRTARTESGATMRAGMQAGMQAVLQKRKQAAESALADKRAAENERGRREDRKFATTMAEVSQEFQAKQAELDRDQRRAIDAGNRKDKEEAEMRREALRRLDIELNMDDRARRDNATLSILKGALNRETSMEKGKTVLEGEATQFDKDKKIYNTTLEKVTEATENDKRMDLPTLAEIKEKIPSKWDIAKGMLGKGPVRGAYAEIQRYRTLGKEVKEGLADPMGVLQDQITQYGGNISVEELAPESINKIEDGIQRGDVKTEDINKTLGALEGMIEAVKNKRNSSDKESDEFDFWQDANLNMAQMRDALEGLGKSKKKIAGSETETVGSRVQYALGTVYNSSLGGRAARMRDLVGGNFEAVFEGMTKSIQVPKSYPITPEMNEYDIELRDGWLNPFLKSRYPEMQQTEIDWGAE